MSSSFQALTLYHKLYDEIPRRFAIPDSSNPVVWQAWQQAFRDRLREHLAGTPAPSAVAYQLSAPTQFDGYRRHYVEYESTPGEIVPGWLLIPDDISGPVPAMIAAHGHSYSVDSIVGIDVNHQDEAESYHEHFAVSLCRQGMVVIAPEFRGFGRRREPIAQAQGPGATSCERAAWWGIMLGRPVLGSRVWDAMRAIDLLSALPEVDASRIGIMGHSGGGAVALLTAALDERIRATSINSYFCTFRDSILAMHHCHCNYIPGLLQDAEMADIAALIAPRPLVIVSGDQDPIFPLAGVLESFERTSDAYHALGADPNLILHVFAGGHDLNGKQSYPLLRGWLTA